MAKVKVHVFLKPGVLDVQGKAVEGALNGLGWTGVTEARVGKLIQFDYGYRVPEALTKYKLFQRMKAVAIQGWGTGDTEALAPTVTADKMPYVTASYSGHLTDPAKTPYNFFVGTSYGDSIKAVGAKGPKAIQAAVDTAAKAAKRRDSYAEKLAALGVVLKD